MKSLDESVVGCCSDRYDEKLAKYVKFVTDSMCKFKIVNVRFLRNFSFWTFNQRRYCRQYYFPVFGNFGQKRSDKAEIYDQGKEL